MSSSTDQKDLDVSVTLDPIDESDLGLSSSESGTSSPLTENGSEHGGRAKKGHQVKKSKPADLESQDSVDELDLIHRSAHKHHASNRKTFGRVHIVEEMDAIAEVDRALELDELRDAVQGVPHSRSKSIHHVHFQLSTSQEAKVREQEEVTSELEEMTEEPDPNAKPDIFGAIFNLMNYALGAGILALPFAFVNAGLIMGIFLVSLVASATVFSMFLLLGASRVAKAYGFEQLARSSYGDNFAQFVKITIIVDSFGALSAYMILIADTTSGIAKNYIAPDTIWANRTLILILVTTFIMLPLCCLKNINSLGFTSALSLVPLVYFMVLQIVYLVKAGGIQSGVKMFSSKLFFAMPLIVFSFSSQQALFPLYTEMQERNGTERHIKQVVSWSLGLTALCYIFSGTLGIFTYPTSVEGNVLNNLPKGIPLDILLITTAVSIILSFPVILWPARVSADRLFFLDRPYSYLRFVLEAVAILALALIIALAIPSFSTILGLFGSLTNTTIGYILPPLYYLKLEPTPWKESWTKKGAIALLVIGATCGLVAFEHYVEEYFRGLLSR